MVAPPTTADAGVRQVLRHLPADRGHGGQAEAGRGQRGGQHHLRRVAELGGQRGDRTGERPAGRRRSPRRRSAPGAAATSSVLDRRPTGRAGDGHGRAWPPPRRSGRCCPGPAAVVHGRTRPAPTACSATTPATVARDSPARGSSAATAAMPNTVATAPPTRTGDHQGRSNAAGAPMVASPTPTPATSYAPGRREQDARRRGPAAPARPAPARSHRRRARPASRSRSPPQIGPGVASTPHPAAQRRPAGEHADQDTADGEAEDRPASPLLRHRPGADGDHQEQGGGHAPAARPGRAPHRSGPAWRSGRW